MSRDRRDPGDAAPKSDARDAALLSAYVDGVAELLPDERRRVEALLARDPQARAEQAAVATLLEGLRELPGAGDEPDWTALERSIRNAVGDSVPAPWWRRWRWLAPAAMLVATAAAVLVMWARPTPVAAPERSLTVSHPTPAPPASDDLVALWLDGSEVDVEPSASDMLDAPELAILGDDDPAQPGSESDEVALLPSSDLAWVDRLDEDALDRAELWLARKKG